MKPLPAWTLNALDRQHGKLMVQLERLFGRQVAGWIVLEMHRQEMKQ